MPAHINKDKGMQVLLRLSPEMTAMLSQAADRSGRSNTKEALVRLEDHLKSFTDLATPGRRFTAEDSDKAIK
ncbi:TraY domain-containing protein [Pantoea sp. DY-5]|uniref:TraY domain-containing protein n=1 Tax=Pantoea sp. DY-5 TaxID=2871488 RepID=UPI001C94C528|nr:TraY domain-containing protein [Pantoea sp. DY-5]MBY4841143.1 TraY domain-containing protein [Pantoea sp. DY-5]